MPSLRYEHTWPPKGLLQVSWLDGRWHVGFENGMKMTPIFTIIFVSQMLMSLAQPPEVGSAAETAAAARAGHRSTLPLAAERIPFVLRFLYRKRNSRYHQSC